MEPNTLFKRQPMGEDGLSGKAHRPSAQSGEGQPNKQLRTPCAVQVGPLLGVYSEAEHGVREGGVQVAWEENTASHSAGTYYRAGREIRMWSLRSTSVACKPTR